jgi:hypothetical protein
MHYKSTVYPELYVLLIERFLEIGYSLSRETNFYMVIVGNEGQTMTFKLEYIQ